MSELQMERDKIAREIYGGKATYNSLSAWARMDIDATIANEIVVQAQEPMLVEDSFQYKIASLQDQLAQSKKENADLWEENESLKMELERLRGDET